jgi:hypothetical protein
MQPSSRHLANAVETKETNVDDPAAACYGPGRKIKKSYLPAKQYLLSFRWRSRASNYAHSQATAKDPKIVLKNGITINFYGTNLQALISYR